MTDTPLTWREATVIRILLFVARSLTSNPAAQRDIQNIATHISVEADAERREHRAARA